MRTIRLFILFFSLLSISAPLMAQDKIYSLSLKEHEIEASIRKNLRSFLKEKDYVIKVRLTGIKKVDRARNSPLEYQQEAGETLPGFEIEEKTALAKISDVIGATYWGIKRMRVDLVMHKEISPSLDTFIRESIPIISELDPSRGDIFNFIPIIPKSLEEEKREDEQLVRKDPNEKEYYGLTPIQWLYTFITIVCLLVVSILIWRVFRLRRNIIALEDAMEDERRFEEGKEGRDPLEEFKKEKEKRMLKQEEIIKHSMLQEKNEKTQQSIITQLLGRNDWAGQLFSELSADRQGVEKMAQFFSILGSSTTRKLFFNVMGEEKYLEIEEMAEEITLKPEQENELLREIQKIIFTKKLTSPEEYEQDPFSFLRDLSPGQVGFLVKDEPVKIKAIVLSQLSSEATAEILSRLPREERGQIVRQIGNMNDLPLELAEKIAFNMADKAKDVPDDNTVGFDAIDLVVDVISDSNAQTRNDLINNLRVSDRKLSAKVESRFFLFESIPVVPKPILTEVVRKLPAEDVITSLVGSPKNLQEKVILCFPEKIRRTLVSSLKTQNPHPDLIREKQKILVRAMRKMAADKKVDLRKIQAAWNKATTQKPASKSA